MWDIAKKYWDWKEFNLYGFAEEIKQLGRQDIVDFLQQALSSTQLITPQQGDSDYWLKMFLSWIVYYSNLDSVDKQQVETKKLSEITDLDERTFVQWINTGKLYTLYNKTERRIKAFEHMLDFLKSNYTAEEGEYFEELVNILNGGEK